MSRLTKVNGSGEVIIIGNEFKAIKKLSKLEDLEDDLGCPLDVVFKALRNRDVYTEDICVEEITLECDRLGNYYFWNSLGDIVFLKDYKKTWWLKEDLSE